MTTVQRDNAELRGSPDGPAPVKGTSPLRLVLLLLVFGVALIGLLYDRTVARPAIAKAKQDVEDLLLQIKPDPNNDNTVTPDEVQLVLGRKPTRVEQRANCMVEVYSWRAGLPTRTYDLKVVYTGLRFPLLFSAAANDEPKYPASTETREQPTAEEAKNFNPPRVGGVGAGGVGAGGDTMQRSAPEPPKGPEKPADQPPADQPPADTAAEGGPPADPTSVNPPADPVPADPATPPADPAPTEPAQDSGGSNS